MVDYVYYMYLNACITYYYAVQFYQIVFILFIYS